jgi:hypothetical protein
MISEEFVRAVKKAKQTRHELAAYGNINEWQLRSILTGRRKVQRGDEAIIKIGSLLGIKAELCFIDDFYLLAVSRLKDPDSPIYASGRGLLPRMREAHRHDHETRVYHRDPNYLLCAGSAVGVCDDNLVRHVQLEFIQDQHQKFVGFLLANQPNDRAIVLTRGCYHLLVQGLENARQGMPIYTFGPNGFTTDKALGGIEIGVVNYRWADSRHRAAVLFRAHYDTKPFSFSSVNLKSRD